MLRNPFFPVKKRLTNYKILAFIWIIISAVVSVENTSMIYREEFYGKMNEENMFVLCIGAILYVILNSGVIWKLLSLRKGLNKQTSKLFLR